MPSRDAEAWPDVLLWLGRTAGVGEHVRLGVDESRHLTRVLRRGAGDRVVLADGAGSWLDAEITDVDAASTTLLVDAVRAAPTEPVARLELAFPILRPARTEWLLEKATELGVTRFVPLRSSRARRHGEKPERWSRIVRSAAMQSLRSTPPEVCVAISIDEWVCGLDGAMTRICASPGGDRVPGEIRGDAAVAVGPEGDFTGAELETFAASGFASVDLGPRRLRAETAAVALCARVAALQGARA